MGGISALHLLKLLVLLACCAGGACADATADGATASNAAAAYKSGDYATAFRLRSALAERGDAAAQVSLGYMYHNGQGVPQDYAKAMSWYRRAADQGNAAAHGAIGYMYAKGDGVPLNYAAAASWYGKSATMGNAIAQDNLGVMYAKGQGVPQDYTAAAFWYRKAAAQSSDGARTLAQKNLQALLNRAPATALSPALPQQSSATEAANLQGQWRMDVPADATYAGIVLIDSQYRATLDASWFREGRPGSAKALGYVQVDLPKVEIILTNRSKVERIVCKQQTVDQMTCRTVLSDGEISVPSAMTRVGPGPKNLMAPS